MTAAPEWVNARDFASIQAAVDSLGANGGVVYIPRGTYNTGSTPSFGPSTLLLPEQPNPVHLIGDGASLTILQASSNSNDLLRIRADGSTVRGIAFIGTNQPGTARGIVIGRQTSGSGLVAPSIKDCRILNTSSWGLYVMGADDLANDLCIFGTFARLRIDGNQTNGGVFIGKNCTTQWFRDCAVTTFRGYAAKLSVCEGIAFDTCAFEDSRDGAQPYIVLAGANLVHLSHCWFEHHEVSTSNYFVRVGDGPSLFCRNVTIDTCRFVHDVLTTARVAQIKDSARGVTLNNIEVVLPSTVGTDDITIEAGSEATIVGGVLATPGGYFPLRIVDGSTNKTTILANNRLRFPRLTSAERVALTDVQQGDLVYEQTSQRLYLFGASWQPLVTQRLRNIVLPAITLRPRIGSSPILDFGTYPNRYSAAQWSGSSTSKDGLGIECAVPDDYVPGTSMTFKILWSYSGPGISQNWVCELDFISRASSELLTAAGTTMSATVSANRGAADTLAVDTVGTSSVGLDPGEALRVNINRNALHASDNYTGQVRFVALVIGYQSA